MVTYLGGSVDLFKKAFAFRVFSPSDIPVGMVMRPQIYPQAL